MTTFCQPASCVECRLCNLFGALYCSECEADKMFGLCPDEPLRIEVTIPGRAAVARVERFRIIDDGRLVPMDDDLPPTVEDLRHRGFKPTDAAARGPRNLGMESEPEEYEPSPYDGTYSED